MFTCTGGNTGVALINRRTEPCPPSRANTHTHTPAELTGFDRNVLGDGFVHKGVMNIDNNNDII